MKIVIKSFIIIGLTLSFNNNFAVMPSLGKMNAKDLVGLFKHDIKKSFKEGHFGLKHRKRLRQFLLMHRPLNMYVVNSRSIAQRLLWKERRFLKKHF